MSYISQFLCARNVVCKKCCVQELCALNCVQDVCRQVVVMSLYDQKEI